jgi:NAD(P)H-hydrate repair Nnr-like enzyme with NAD(P)H-hydrate dehydratase domain
VLVVLLKGPDTVGWHHRMAVPPLPKKIAHPGLATAGSGDGVLAGFVAGPPGAGRGGF